jgi:hypothetical protein
MVGGAADDAAVGVTVFKTGRTTGTTSGKVARQCVDTLVTNPAQNANYVALCSSEIDSSSFSTGGDSGSAIWYKETGTVRVVGVLSYGRTGATGYSPWAGVKSVLGTNIKFK